MGEEIREEEGERSDVETNGHGPKTTAAVTSPADSKSSRREMIVIGKSDRNILENPTDLYVLLQNKKWAASLLHLKDHLKEAGTWIYRKDEKERLVWRLLPLHASIILEAPEKVIKSLLAAYPQGAQSQDDQGMLPVHLSFRAGISLNVVTLLLESYPKSVEVRDFKGRLPLELAQASSAPNREAFLKALDRGPSYFSNAELATARAAAIVAVTQKHEASFSAQLTQVNESHQNELERFQADVMGKRAAEIESIRSKAFNKQQELVDRISSLENSNRVYQQEIESIRADASHKEGTTCEIQKAHQVEIERMLLEATKKQQDLKDKIAWLEIDLECAQEEAMRKAEEQIIRIRAEAAGEKQKLMEHNKLKNTSIKEVNDKSDEQMAKITDLETRLEMLKTTHEREIETLKSETYAKEQALRDVIVATKIETAKNMDETTGENRQLKAQLNKLVASEKNSTKALSETMDILEMQETEWSKTNKALKAKIKETENTLAASRDHNSILTAQLQEKLAELEQAFMQFENTEDELNARNNDRSSKLKTTEHDLATEKAEKVLLSAAIKELKDEKRALQKRVEAERAKNRDLWSQLSSNKANVENQVEELSSKVAQLSGDLANSISKLATKDAEEKEVQSRLEALISTEDELTKQINFLVSRLDEVKAEGKEIENRMTRQMEILQNEKDALQGTIMVLTKSMSQQQDDLSSRAGSRTGGSSLAGSLPPLSPGSATKKWEMLED